MSPRRCLLAVPALLLVLGGCFFNQGPTISSAVPSAATEGVEYSYSPVVSDPDGPGQSWSFLGTDTCGGSIGATTGTVTFTQGPGSTSSCIVAIQVCDGGTPNRCATQSGTVTIARANFAPTITSTPPPSAIFDLDYLYYADATDPDGPGEVWSLHSSNTCDGMINAAGVYATLVPAQASCVLAIQVCDGGTPNRCAIQATTISIS